MKVQQKIYSYGVSPLESALAGEAPGPLPRRDPPQTTGRNSQRKRGARQPKRDNFSGQTTTAAENNPSSGPDKDKSKKKDKTFETFNIVQFNISGLSTKKAELSHFLSKNHIHVALIQETEKGKDTDTKITGYTEKHCECNKCQGIITYIRNDVTGSTENISLGHSTDVQKTSIWHSDGKFYIYNIYNPPGNNLHLPYHLEALEFQKSIVAGDFNGHSPSWGYQDLNNTGKSVEEICNSTNLFLVQDENSTPTLLHRVHKTLSRPDLTLLSSDLLNKYSSEVADGIGNSDHRPIITTIKTTTKKKFVRRTRWNFKKASWDLYKATTDSLLSKVDMSSGNVEKLEKEISSEIIKAASLCIPKGCRKKYKPFWNKNLDIAVTAREKARKRLEKSPTVPNRIAYNRTSAEAKRLINSSKKETFQNTCRNLDLAKDGNKAWSLINNLNGENRVTNPRPLKTSEGDIADEQRKANAHNKFFASITKSNKVTEEDKILYKELKSREKAPSANVQIFEEAFSITELNRALRKLKARKSPGPDGLHNEMLKNLGPKAKTVLLLYMNMTWNQGLLPNAWKTAIVKPILKKGKPAEDLSSYRPISLTSCFGKITERMINDRLYFWLESNKILNAQQAGFRSGRRTDDQLFKLSQKVIDGFYDKQSTTAIFVDLQQAYDRIWRKGLLLKMQKIGIHGKMYDWIKHFLTNRMIQTKYNNAISSKQILEEGLPQGSALSCTLFLIFINDLPSQLRSEKALYADDLALWHTHKNVGVSAILLNEDLKRLEEYCKHWKLKINCNKTVYTIFSKSSETAQRKVTLEIEGKHLKKEENPVYLGVTLDRQLTLKEHVRKLGEKSTRRLKIVKRLASTQWGADKKTLRQLYIGYVRSVMEYNLPLQAISSDTTMNSLDKIESQAVHFISGGMRSTPTEACHIETNIQPLGLRREAAVLEMVERYKRGDKSEDNTKLVESWKPNTRIKQKSILKVEKALQEKHHLPTNRERETTVNKTIPPNISLRKPIVQQDLKHKVNKKTDDLINLKITGLETIQSYPDHWIHVYTDGSALKGTVNAGYGVKIFYPDEKPETISNPCGALCSNFEAETLAIEAALHQITQRNIAKNTPTTDIVIFSDSKSVLQAIDSDKQTTRSIRDLRLAISNFIDEFSVNVTLQWIPSHCDIPGNESADRLAKEGASQEQPNLPVSLNTCKQIIKSNTKIEWLNTWAQSNKGRAIFPYMTRPNTDDPINSLGRKEQVTIFRLRSQHIQLNMHLNRIKPEHPPACELCPHPYETVKHFLFECPTLEDIRKTYLPPSPDLENTLYTNVGQLRNTCKYFNMANSRRANAQMTAGSE